MTEEAAKTGVETTKDEGMGAQPEITPAGVTSDTAQKVADAVAKSAAECSPSKGDAACSGGDGVPDDRSSNVAGSSAAPGLDDADDVGPEIDPGEPAKKPRKKNKRKGGLVGHKTASGFEG